MDYTTKSKNADDVIKENEVSVAPSTGRAVRDFFSTDEIFQRVAASADEELSLSMRLIFFSGLAAGLSIGLSIGKSTTSSIGLSIVCRLSWGPGSTMA